MDNLEVVWGLVRELYKERKVKNRLSNLDLKMFCNPDKPRAAFPVLSAHAAETASLLPLLAQVCSDMSSGSPRDEQRLACALRLMQVEEVLRTSGTILSDAQHMRLVDAMFAAMQHYTNLAAMAAANSQLLFNVVNKHHYLLHLAMQAKHLNPRLAWCYCMEDLVGKVQRVAAKSTDALSQTKLPKKVFQKWRVAVRVAMQKH